MDILEHISNLNWQTIVAMFAISWYFTHEIKEDLLDLKSDMKKQGERIDAQGARIDRLYQMFVDLLKEKSK